MDIFLKILTLVSLLWMINGLLIKKIRRWHATEVQFALLVGVLAGPVTGYISDTEVSITHSIFEWSCKFTIALALSSAALRIPKKFLKSNRQLLSIVVIAGMFLMALATTLLVKAVLIIGWAGALLLGWILTPTDPVITATAVTGERARSLLPPFLRNTVTFESGVNDGLAAPMVILAITFLDHQQVDWAHWIVQVVGYENLLASIIALGIGYYAGKILKQAHHKGWMSGKTLLPFSLALTFSILGGLELLKMNAIIGVFFANLGLARTITTNEDLEEKKMEEVMEHLFTIPVFFLLGLILPWEDWLQLGWPLAAVAILVVLFRRLPAFLLLNPVLPNIRTLAGASWLGWIGPIGVAALLYALMAEKEAGFALAWPVTTLVVCFSVVIHGATSLYVSQIYHRKAGKQDGQEDKPA